MRITRKTLELAALAAGHELRACYDDHPHCRSHALRVHSDDRGRLEWRPHLDDCDAARLAVRLHITSCVNEDCAEAWLGDCSLPASVTLVEIAHDGTEPDKLRAWREAVVLCAAAVGERMKGGE